MGDREGARILGQILVNKGQFEDALPLLHAYAEERLNRLHAQEVNYNAVVKRVDDRAVERWFANATLLGYRELALVIPSSREYRGRG